MTAIAELNRAPVRVVTPPMPVEEAGVQVREIPASSQARLRARDFVDFGVYVDVSAQLLSDYALTDAPDYPDQIKKAAWKLYLYCGNGHDADVRQQVQTEFGPVISQDAEWIIIERNRAKALAQRRNGNQVEENKSTFYDDLTLARKTAAMITSLPPGTRQNVEEILGLNDTYAIDILADPKAFDTLDIETKKETVAFVLAILATLIAQGPMVGQDLGTFYGVLDGAYYASAVGLAVSHARTTLKIGKTTNVVTNTSNALLNKFKGAQNQQGHPDRARIVQAIATGVIGTVGIEGVKELIYHSLPVIDDAIHRVLPLIPEDAGDNLFSWITVFGIATIGWHILRNEQLIRAYAKVKNTSDTLEGHQKSARSLEQFALYLERNLFPGLREYAQLQNFDQRH